MTMIDPGVSLDMQPQMAAVEVLPEIDEFALAEQEWQQHVRAELGALAGEGTVVVDYSVEGWRKSGTYGLLWELEGKTVTITSMNKARDSSGTVDSILSMHWRREREMDQDVVSYLNLLAQQNRPVKPAPEWQRDL